MAAGLTVQQERFARMVASGKSQSEAYRQAYPGSQKWLAKSVHERASALANRAKVAARIAGLREKASRAADLSAEKILREIARVAFVDPRRLVNEDGSVKGLHELDEDLAAAVSSIEVDEYGKVKYKLWVKNQALDMLMKHMGLYEKDNSQSAPPVIQEIRLVALQPAKEDGA